MLWKYVWIFILLPLLQSIDVWLMYDYSVCMFVFAGLWDASMSVGLSCTKHTSSWQVCSAPDSMEIWLLDSGMETKWGLLGLSEHITVYRFTLYSPKEYTKEIQFLLNGKHISHCFVLLCGCVAQEKIICWTLHWQRNMRILKKQFVYILYVCVYLCLIDHTPVMTGLLHVCLQIIGWHIKFYCISQHSFR